MRRWLHCKITFYSVIYHEYSTKSTTIIFFCGANRGGKEMNIKINSILTEQRNVLERIA